jgi:cysteinyl-tRNA synthetase
MNSVQLYNTRTRAKETFVPADPSGNVQNITDVDDKIIRRARELGTELSAVARRYEQAYLDDMSKLRNDSVDVYARALAVLFDLVREQNRDSAGGQQGRALVADFLATFALDADAGSGVLGIDVDRLIEEREQHRRNRRFADADRIRDQLAAHGVILEDSPAGVRWRRSGR